MSASLALTPAAPAQSLPALAERWIAYVDAAPKTAATYAKAIGRFLSWLRESDITAPDRPAVLAFRESLRARGRAAATVSAYMTAVRRFFRWTALEGLYPDVAQDVKAGRPDEGHKKDALTREHVRRVLALPDRTTLAGLRDYAILSLMLSTGLRCCSVCRADVADLGTLGDEPVLHYQGKGRAEKNGAAKLAPAVDAAIRDYLAARGKLPQDAPLFGSLAHAAAGGRMATGSLSRLVREYLEKAGVKTGRVTAHSLRHTAATAALLAGSSLLEVQQMLDHRSITTTERYLHTINRQNNTAELKAAAWLFG